MKSGSYFLSTIGRKQIMAVAGLLLCGFVLAHAAGNMLIFFGADAYNKYGHAIVSNPLIYVAEFGLVVFFLSHIVSGVAVTLRNWGSKPKEYARPGSGDKKTSATTRFMWLQGLIILGFVVLHLFTFKYGNHYSTSVEGVEMRDLFRLIQEVFSDPVYVVWYVFSLVILCYHLAHGFYSALQTLGVNHPEYTPKIKCASLLYGLAVSGAFLSQPIYVYFFL